MSDSDVCRRQALTCKVGLRAEKVKGKRPRTFQVTLGGPGNHSINSSNSNDRKISTVAAKMNKNS